MAELNMNSEQKAAADAGLKDDTGPACRLLANLQDLSSRENMMTAIANQTPKGDDIQFLEVGKDVPTRGYKSVQPGMQTLTLASLFGGGPGHVLIEDIFDKYGKLKSSTCDSEAQS